MAVSGRQFLLQERRHPQPSSTDCGADCLLTAICCGLPAYRPAWLTHKSLLSFLSATENIPKKINTPSTPPSPCKGISHPISLGCNPLNSAKSGSSNERCISPSTKCPSLPWAALFPSPESASVSCVGCVRNVGVGEIVLVFEANEAAFKARMTRATMNIVSE